MTGVRRIVPVLGAALLVLGGCSSSPGRGPDAADVAFLQQMTPHHRRALAVARIGLARGHDPRVVAFAQRIVREQTPEYDRMTADIASTHTTVDARAGARMATGYLTDADVARLSSEQGAAFDRDFLALNITSEQGAAAMARTELAGGRDATALSLARGIASAPTGEIPQLQALLTALG